MGLSKKLGGSSQKTGLPSSNNVPYKWSNQTYTVEEVLKKFKLPCVVQCATDSCTVVWSDFQFDLRQPLLFYSKRSVQKVHAVSLQQTNDVLEEIGPPLAIPEDYEGWFGAAPKCNSIAKRHFRVEGMANSTAQQFLVTTKCPAFTSNRSGDGQLQHVPHDVTPGEVLKRVCVMDTDIAHPDCPDLVKEHGPCLEFLDEKGDDVIIPLSYSVLTYEIGDIYPDEETRIFKINSPINAGNSKLPRILTLIHGDPPLLAYAFTGTVRCYSVFTEETILAATLEDPGSRCLELITDSCVKFRLCLNEVIVKKTCEYANAFQMCENFGAKFITGIKVSFTLKPDVSNLGDADLSFCESASDMQEVEANSEFDIAWGSVKKARLFIGSDSLEKDKNGFSEDAPIILDEILSEKIAEHKIKPFPKDLSEDSDVSDCVLPQHRDFTEREIVDLMLRKGLVGSADKTNIVPCEMDLLKDNRVTDNPLFYFFQRNPDQNPWKSDEPENDESVSDEPSQEMGSIQNPNDMENPLLYLFEKEPLPVSSEAEIKNPLSYLFDQTLVQSLSSDKSLTEIFSNKNHTSPYKDLQSSFLSSVSDLDVSDFHQVVCKTARAYTGSDEDEDEENDDSTESDKNYSDISELSDDNSELSFPSDTLELSFPKENDVPNTNGKHSMRLEASGIPVPEAESQKGKVGSSMFQDMSGAPLIYKRRTFAGPSGDATTTRTFAGPSGDATTTEEADNLDVSLVDEEEAVVDLLTLAEAESIKYSGTSSLDNVVSSRNNGGSTNKQGKDGGGDSVHRLNSLLEEVSQLVNISSGRTLDANNKTPVYRQQKTINVAPHKKTGPLVTPRPQKTINAAAHKRDGPIVTPRLQKTQRNNSSSVANSSESISTKSSEAMLTDAELNITEKKQSQYMPDKNSMWDFTVDNVDALHPGLNQIQSEGYMGALRRSHVELRLDHVGQEDTTKNCTTAHKSHRTSPSESSISSIFSAAHNHRNKLDSAQESYSSQNHPSRHPSEIHDIKSDYTHSSEIHDIKSDYTHSSEAVNDGQKHSFPYKNQRILSLIRGRNVLGSSQNLDRSNSTQSSTSSNFSNSLDNSFVQGSPKLVVIGDPGLVLENNHRLTQMSSEDFTGSSTSQLPKFVSNSNRRYAYDGEGIGDGVKFNENYNDSRNENQRSDSLNLNQEEYSHFPDEYDGLNEDYV